MKSRIITFGNFKGGTGKSSNATMIGYQLAQQGHAPFITVVVFMRGLLSHAYTRLYFSDEAPANAVDPVLQSVPAQRRNSIIAQRHETPTGVQYNFDIYMQGDQETVFFEV